jgi:hypothetical protein
MGGLKKLILKNDLKRKNTNIIEINTKNAIPRFRVKQDQSDIDGTSSVSKPLN